MIIYENIIQQTPEWFAIKDGKMSASHGTAIGNCGAGLKTYARKLVKEMRPNHVRDNYTNKDMERGNNYEPIARQVYEYENDLIVKQVGFVQHNDFVGCSPDGLVGVDGGLELKARNDDIHWGLLLGDAIDSGTIWQMNMCMLICNRKWWDFGSYNPNFKKSLFVKRFFPDEKKQASLLKGFGLGEQMIKELLENENVQFELK